MVKGRQRGSKQERRSDETFTINALPLTSQRNPFAGVTLRNQSKQADRAEGESNAQGVGSLQARRFEARNE